MVNLQRKMNSQRGFGTPSVSINWFSMLSKEMHWSFVLGVVVYGISQGLGEALSSVGTKYYMKDVQKVQPSEAQAYAGILGLLSLYGVFLLMFSQFSDTEGDPILCISFLIFVCSNT